MPNRSLHIFPLISWLNALLGFSLLVLQWTTGDIPDGLQMGYFLLLIGGTGIPHGALDHIIAKNNSDNNKNFNIQQFLGKYMLAIITYSVCWIFFPSISLMIFLIISAWHFGETDLSDIEGKNFWNNTGRITWGIFILMMILLTHEQETLSVIERITKKQTTAIQVWQFFSDNSYLGLIITGLYSSIFLLSGLLKKQKSLSLSRLFNLILILFLCSQLPLLPAFALYFGGWHAIRSFELTFKFLHHHKEETAADPMTMWKNALPMTFLAAFGFIFMAYIWTGLGIKTDPIPALFIFLSIITLPHLDVMDKLIRSDKPSGIGG